MDPIYLNFGCGDTQIPDFINIDLNNSGVDMQFDLTKPLPWKHASVDGIYSEHFFERITSAQTIRLLMECRRILRPGGIVRIVATDMAAVIDDYLRADQIMPDDQRTASPCERLNSAMRSEGRQWLYDEEELVRIGKMVGLSFKGRCKPNDSSDQKLKNLESGTEPVLILELEKPQRQILGNEKPLVTIAIPAYHDRYFAQALESAIRQTYENLDILICDDCEGDAIERIALKYASEDKRIRYMRNPPETARKNLGRENYKSCMRHAKGEFIKFLNDDDLLAPECVAEMVACFSRYPDITLVTSKRQRIDMNGNFLHDITATQSPVAEDSLIDGLSLGRVLFSTKINFVGEPTTPMYRKAEIEDLLPDYMSMEGQRMIGVSDVCTWLNLLTKGDAIYLVKPLSYFRIHAEQVQAIHSSVLTPKSERSWEAMQASWERRGLLAE